MNRLMVALTGSRVEQTAEETVEGGLRRLHGPTGPQRTEDGAEAGTERRANRSSAPADVIALIEGHATGDAVGPPVGFCRILNVSLKMYRPTRHVTLGPCILAERRIVLCVISRVGCGRPVRPGS